MSINAEFLFKPKDMVITGNGTIGQITMCAVNQSFNSVYQLNFKDWYSAEDLMIYDVEKELINELKDQIKNNESVSFDDMVSFLGKNGYSITQSGQ